MNFVYVVRDKERAIWAIHKRFLGAIDMVKHMRLTTKTICSFTEELYDNGKLWGTITMQPIEE